MNLRPGIRLQSAVCDGQVVVVRAPDGDVDLRFGGRPAREAGAPAVAAGGPEAPEAPDPAFVGETPIGKRYHAPGLGLEVLVTKAASTLLTVGDTPLERRDAKPLPASD